jgi:phage portal protein BeeE
MQLLPPKQVAKFDFDQMLRGNLKARMEAYAKGNSFGMMNANEARAKENMAPYEGGDRYFVNGSSMPISHQEILDNPEAANVAQTN